MPYVVFWLRENSNHVTLRPVVVIVYPALTHPVLTDRSCRGVWGALLGGSKPPAEEPSSTAVEGTAADTGQPGTAVVHSVPKPTPAATGPAWGGAGLPSRIQVSVTTTA
jgi:hypothetical protein